MDWRLKAFDKGIDDQVRMHYQPVVWLDSAELYGAEMLMRWHHPERGLLQPYQWITLAAEHGALVSIFKSLIPSFSQFTPSGLKLSFNLTSTLFNDSSLVETLLALPASVISQLCLEVHQLQFCLDEVSIDNPWHWVDVPDLEQKLSTFKARGFSVWLDDYGEGSRNEKTLRHLAVSVVKLDRCFVDGPVEELMPLVERIHAGGKLVLIECLETEAQREVMLAAGVDLAQGYLYARVMEAGAFEVFINTWGN